MKESDLRAWHRNLGIILSLFIILQTVTDLLISLSEAGVPHTHANSEAPRPQGGASVGKTSGTAPKPPGFALRATPRSPLAIPPRASARGILAKASESVVQANTHGEVKSKWIASIAFIHHGAGAIGMFYRILLGIGMLGMAVSGSMIFFKVRAHSKKY